VSPHPRSGEFRQPVIRPAAAGLFLRGWRDGWGDQPGGGKDCGQLPPGLRGFLSTLTPPGPAIPQIRPAGY